MSNNDYYGLPADLEARAQAVHQGSVIFDGTFSTLGFQKEEEEEIRAMLDGGVTGGAATVSSAETDFEMAIRNIAQMKRLSDRHPDAIAIVRSVQDLLACKRDKKFGIVLHFQGSKPIGEKLERVSTFYELGLRIFQMTYNTQTYIGAGCCERGDAGLTNFGLEVVKECNRLGLLLDISHCGPQTSLDTLKYSQAPVVASHAGVYDIARSFGRNKTDDIIKAIGDTGGLIGIPFQPCFVKRDPETHVVQQATVDDVLDHVDHVVKLIGVDHVGLGTDMSTYAARTLEPPRDSNIRLMRTARPDVFGVGPTDKYDPFPLGVDSHRLLINLTRGLVKRGYSDEDTAKVIGGNWMRVFRSVWM